MSVQLRRHIGREEFDYPALTAALSGIANASGKITSLLRKGVIVRVKKGLYVFGADYSLRPYSRELLANLIYGPSFLSLEYALSHHGLIPEQVEQLTSVTTGRAKEFKTPVGTFVFRPAAQTSFHLGMHRAQQGQVSFLIASAERALADKVREDRSATVRSLADAESYLFEDLRVDESVFRELNLGALRQIGDGLGSRKVAFCAKLLHNIQGKS